MRNIKLCCVVVNVKYIVIVGILLIPTCAALSSQYIASLL